MGFFKRFIEFLSGGTSNRKGSSSRRRKSDDSKQGGNLKREEDGSSSPDEGPLPQVRTGTVDYLEEDWAIIETSTSRNGFLHISEFANERIESLENRLQEGEEIEYVVLKRSDKNSSRDEVSISAVEEVKTRKRLHKISLGDFLEVEVENFEAKFVRVITENGIPGRIYARNLSYGLVRPGDLHRHIDRDEKVEVRVKEKVLPDGWRENKRARCARLKFSREATLPERDGETFEMSFAATPFCVETSPKLPRRFDPIARFVFEALYEGHSQKEIRDASGLPEDSLRQIIELLTELGLIGLTEEPTSKGERMYRAMEWSDQFNEKNLEGLFSSTAPLGNAFLSTGAIDESSMPRGWPNPMWCPQTQEQFMRAGEEDLPGLPFEEIFPAERIEEIQEAIQNPELWTYLRPNYDRPKYVRVKCPVSDEWLFSTLWLHLESAEHEHPFRPDQFAESSEEIRDRAKRVRLVALHLSLSSEEDDPDEVEMENDLRGIGTANETMSIRLWWEPVSDTFWHSPEDEDPQVARWHSVKSGNAYPDLPKQWWTRIRGIPSGAIHPVVTDKKWVSMVSYYGYRD